MIKNIIFDLSEVIISGYHGIETLMEERYQIKANEFNKRKEDTLDLFLKLMRGNGTEDEYLRELIKETNWNVNTEEVKEAIRDNLNIPVEGTMDIIKKLEGKYKLILLSDHVKEWVDYILENNKELSIFDKIFFSYKSGRLKQDSDTFKNILKELELNANETILIDDYQENIDSAKRQGIDGILFINAQQLEHDLSSKYNILI